MRLEQYLNEEVIKLRHSFKFDKLKKDKKSFYNDRQMVGHDRAIERVDQIENLFAKVTKTRKQKMLALLLIDFDSTDWHYFVIQTSKKDLQIYSYILRRIDKVMPYNLLAWLDNKSGILKTQLTHILEYMSYLSNDKALYLKNYCKSFSFYGLKSDESEERFNKYHKGLEKYPYIKFIKKNWR